MVKCFSRAISLTDQSIKSTVHAKHYSKFYHHFAHQLSVMHLQDGLIVFHLIIFDKKCDQGQACFGKI